MVEDLVSIGSLENFNFLFLCNEEVELNHLQDSFQFLNSII